MSWSVPFLHHSPLWQFPHFWHNLVSNYIAQCTTFTIMQFLMHMSFCYSRCVTVWLYGVFKKNILFPLHYLGFVWGFFPEIPSNHYIHVHIISVLFYFSVLFTKIANNTNSCQSNGVIFASSPQYNLIQLHRFSLLKQKNPVSWFFYKDYQCVIH